MKQGGELDSALSADGQKLRKKAVVLKCVTSQERASMLGRWAENIWPINRKSNIGLRGEVVSDFHIALKVEGPG